MAYDSSTANPVNPQGTAGGGNSFNVAPLFGEGSFFMGGSTRDSGAASTSSTDTAAMGGNAVPTIGATSVGTPAASTSINPIWFALAGVGLIVAFFSRRKKS